MARIDTLPHFLTDVADAIRTKTGSQETIQASTFDTAIANIPSGGADLSEYFDTEPTSVTATDYYTSPWIEEFFIKKLPNLTIPNTISNLSNICYYSRLSIMPKIIFGNNITNLRNMFSYCVCVTNIDVSGFNIENVTNVNNMFGNCGNLLSLDLSTFGESKISDARSMFVNCNKLTTINLSNFTVSDSVSSVMVGQMFDKCSALTTLDMRKFDFTKSYSPSNMFRNVPTDCLIIVKDSTQKDWFTTNFSTLTNVQTVEEYEGS